MRILENRPGAVYSSIHRRFVMILLEIDGDRLTWLEGKDGHEYFVYGSPTSFVRRATALPPPGVSGFIEEGYLRTEQKRLMHAATYGMNIYPCERLAPWLT